MLLFISLFFLCFTVSAANNMQYGQNISIPYSQPQSDLNFLNAAAAADHKGKIHPKIERDREEGESATQAAGWGFYCGGGRGPKIADEGPIFWGEGNLFASLFLPLSFPFFVLFSLLFFGLLSVIRPEISRTRITLRAHRPRPAAQLSARIGSNVI